MTIIRTIGAGGQHSDINDWVAWVVANATDTDGNLTDHVMGQITNAELVVNNLQVITGWKSGPNDYSTTLTTVPGNSFRNSVNVINNPLYYNATSGAALHSTNFNGAIQFAVDNLIIENLQILCSGGFGPAIYNALALTSNLDIYNCLIISDGYAALDGLHTGGLIQLRNSLFIGGHGVWRLNGTSSIVNCTFIGTSRGGVGINNTSDSSDIKLINTVLCGFTTNLQNDFNGSFSGSNNATDKAVWDGGNLGGGTNAQLNLIASAEFVNSTNDFRVKNTSTKLLGNGIKVVSPRKDIIDQIRPSTPTIGAWEAAPVLNASTISPNIIVNILG